MSPVMKCLSVAKNEQRHFDYDYFVQNSLHLLEYDLTIPEYCKLASNYFPVFTKKYGFIYDECESDEIPPAMVKFIYNDIKDKNEDIPVFYEAIELAVKYNTCVYMDF